MTTSISSEIEYLLTDIRHLSNAAALAAIGIEHISQDNEVGERDVHALVEINKLVAEKIRELSRQLLGTEV